MSLGAAKVQRDGMLKILETTCSNCAGTKKALRDRIAALQAELELQVQASVDKSAEIVDVRKRLLRAERDTAAEQRLRLDIKAENERLRSARGLLPGEKFVG